MFAVSSTDKTEQKLFASSWDPSGNFSEQKNFACTVDDSLDLDYDVSSKQNKMFTSHSSGVSHNLQQSSLPQGEVFIELLESLKGVITKFEFLVNESLGLQNKSLNSQSGAGSPDFYVSD